MSDFIMYLPAILAVIGLIFMAIKMSWVKKQDPGSEKMQSISKSIKEGALAFLTAEYRLLVIFVVAASIALFGVSLIVPSTHWIIVVAFIVGAVFSAFAGNQRFATSESRRGMKTHRGNQRSTWRQRLSVSLCAPPDAHRPVRSRRKWRHRNLPVCPVPSQPFGGNPALPSSADSDRPCQRSV